MSIAVIFPDIESPDHEITEFSKKQLSFYDRVSHFCSCEINVVARSNMQENFSVNKIKVNLRKDQLPAHLTWWQEPEELFRFIAKLDADVLHMCGMDRPLLFRWLRRQTGEVPYILAQHNGEQIWPNMRIWLQQFGMRSADGFIFSEVEDAEQWQKHALVLPRQDSFKIKNLYQNPGSLAQVYQDILKQR